MQTSLSLVRLCLGYAVAPLMTPLFFLAFGWLSGGVVAFRGTAAFAFFATPIAYLVAFVFGTVLVVFLGERGQTSGGMFALGGAAIGVIPGLIFLLLLPLCMGAGALSAWVFWLCVYWKPNPR